MRLLAGRRHWLVPAGVVLLAALTLALAPEERTLGAGILSVYVHAALIWVGIAGLAAAGAAGLGALLGGAGRWARLARAIGWIGLGFFAAGLALSVVAAEVNWGGAFWAEPRMAAGINLVVGALLVQLTAGWFPSARFRGLLHVAVAGVMAALLGLTPLVLHPRDPISGSSATAIQATFAALFALAGVLAGWVFWRLWRRREPEAG